MSDPITPPVLIIDQNRSFREWLIDEIYAPNKPGRYVPNVDDAVRDWDQGLFRVIAVDYTTGISTLSKWREPQDSSGLEDQDILLGSGPGYRSESFRVFLDTSVTPYTLATDRRLKLYGSTVQYIKIFLGTDVGQNGEVISAYYDQSGNLLGENIPVELVATQGLNNIAVKAPKVGYTSFALNDNEVVTIVVYDDEGHAVSLATMLIKNTAFIRSASDSLKYITAIHLETPFLSGSDNRLIQYPINMPVENLNLMGVVTYSDGSTNRLPIDGTKFSLMGLDNYIATVQGQKLPLVLTYKLSANEYSYVLTQTQNKTITELYQAQTQETDGAYSVKLFAYPTWVNTVTGYRMEYYLYNLDRETVRKVTSLVELATGSAVFNPLLFGTLQKISVAIDMNEVDPMYAPYRHVQTLEIALLSHGNVLNQDNWRMGFSPNQDPLYGFDLKATADFINTNNWTIDISCGAATLEEWLERVYYATQPLFDSQSEEEAPVPNFFTLVSGNHRVEVPIADWNSPITAHEAPAQGGLIFLEFMRRNAGTDLQLGISGLVVHRI